MKIIPRSPSARCLLLIAFFAVTLVAGPSVIQSIYRSNTSLSENQVQTEKYYYLLSIENSETPVSSEQRSRLEAEQRRLAYWFHARGWSIDEGHEGRNLFERWRELFRYWTDAGDMENYPIVGK